MVAIPLQTLEELEISAEEFERLVDLGLKLSIIRITDREDIEEALAQVDQNAIDAILIAWAAYVSSDLLPHINESMIEAGTQTLARLSLAVENPLTLIADQPLDVEAYLQQAANRLVGIGNELWFNARSSLAEGIALGESQPKLAQRIRDAIGVTQPRARTIARTESHGARSTAAHMTMQRFESAYGVPPGVMRKEWQATEDARTRPEHHEADGQTVGFSDPFIVGGASLAFPGDPTGPASLVINCRCAILAVFDPNDLNLNDNGTVITLNAAAYQEENAMPWSVQTDNPECGEGQHAVVKDADGTVEGCHDTRDEALAQVAALYASETDSIPASNRNTVPWSGVLVVEGTRTGDGREFAPGALTWPEVGQTESLELDLGWMYERAHGGMSTDKVATVGRIDTITRVGNELHGTGVINLDSEWGRRAAREMGTRDGPGFLAGVSIDADDPEDPFQADIEYVFPEGCSLTEAEVTAEGGESLAEPAQAGCEVPESVRYHTGRIRAATLVAIPAFVEGRIYLDQPVSTDIPVDDMDTVTASAYTITIPDLPPVEWFSEPEDEPEIGAITVTEDGRFYGYLAPKQVAHRGIRNKRVTVPTGNVDYGIWMNRATIVDDGRGGFTKIATGPITMDCGHAPMSPKGAARREHYDNACSVVATARVGENSRGVWISGALMPGVNADQVSRMMACQLSGDWGPHRERPGKRELAAALLVPVPGFPTAQRSFTIRGGELAKTMTPVRFGTFAGVTEPVGIRAAIAQIAAQAGRDPETRMREFVSSLRETLKGD